MSAAAEMERINFRLDPRKKQVIEQAAAAKGLTLTQFAILTLYREAQDVLQSEQMLILTDRDRDAFLGALDHPPKVNEKLLREAKNYKAAKSNGRLRSL